jgi:hypothetical protein
MATAQTENTTTAAGTSTSVATPTAPTKNWNAFVTSDTSIDQTNTKAIESVTSLGGSYSFGATKLTLTQAFETATNQAYSFAKDQLEENNFRPMFLEPSASHVVKKFLGTDQTKFSVKARFYNNDNAVFNSMVLSKSIRNHYNLAADSELMIAPQVGVNLHTEARIYEYSDIIPVGTRLSLLPGAFYAFSDTFSVYQVAGYIMNTKDGETLRQRKERAYLETGLNYSPKALSGLNLNLLVYQDKLMSSKEGDKVTAFNLYSSADSNGWLGDDAVVYEAVVNYTY